MRDAAKKFEFERAAKLRDRVRALRERELAEVLNFLPELSAEITPNSDPQAVESPAIRTIVAKPNAVKGTSIRK
jgi:hypothetical protein